MSDSKRKPLTEEQKARQREANRRWLAKPGNREKARAATKRWEQQNAEYIKAKARDGWADPDSRAKKQAQYRSWADRNREQLSAKAAAGHARRRSQIAEAGGSFTAAEWREMIETYDNRCGYCGAGGVRLERDHIIPVADGGRHEASNIIPACRTCNASKGTKPLEEWLAA